MAWIKAEMQTPKKGEVLRVAIELKISRREAYATCMEFWMWADGETQDGDLPGYTLEIVDQIIELPGFGAAMCKVKWLEQIEGGLRIPNWQHHNGESTKKRIQATRREQRHRIKRSQGK